MTKTFWGILAAIVIIFGITYAVTRPSSSSNNSNASGATEHIEGNTASAVKLVEYGDYECPYCEEYYPVVKQVVSDEASKISFQFRNYPLTSIHPNAFAGARAAEAAGLMGKFWQMHDLLYDSSNWQQWSTASDPTPYFTQYAKELGLNLSTFNTDYASSKVNSLIQADISAGNNLNIQGTPTFYLNGKQINVTASVQSFESLINKALANNGKVSQTSSGATSQTKSQTTPSKTK